MRGLSVDLHLGNTNRPSGSWRRQNSIWPVTFAAAAAQAPAAETQAFIERGVAYIRAVRWPQACVDFDRPEGGVIADELYVFRLYANGITLADSGSPHIVGHDMSDVDSEDGRQMTVGIGQTGLNQGSDWPEHCWPNAATKRIELKAIWLLEAGDEAVCASGDTRSAAP